MINVPVTTTLDTLPAGSSATVVRLAHGDSANTGVDVARRLMELGFVPGERLRVLKRGVPGGDPIAVKVGESTFALRRFEAALITIELE
jgi:ferrous iron transport protein A